MKKFHYNSSEKRVHKGKHITRKVVIKGGKGYKSVTMKRGKRNHTVKHALKDNEIHQIKNGKFIKGLFKDCKKGAKCP